MRSGRPAASGHRFRHRRRRLGAPPTARCSAASRSRSGEADRGVRDVERVPAQVADAGVDEVDDVAEAQPVDEVAERAAEQQPEGDRQVAASARPGRGSRRSGRPRRSTPAPKSERLAAEQPEQAAVVLRVDEADEVADDVDRLARREDDDEPGLRELVEDDDRGGEPEEDRPRAAGRADARPMAAPPGAPSAATARSHAPRHAVPGPPPAVARARSWHGPGRRGSTVARRSRRPDRRPARSREIRSASVSRATAARCGSTAAGSAVDPQLDPGVEVEPGVLAEVLDRALELAGVALGAQLGRELGVDDDDEALVVGDGGARAAAWPGSRPRRARASRRPASTEPSAWISNAPSRAAAITAGIAAPSRLPIFGSSGLTRRSTSSDSSPISSTALTLTSSRDQREQRVGSGSVARRAARATAAPAAAGSGARPVPRSVRASSTARRATPSTPRARSSRSGASSSAGQRVRWTLSGAAGIDASRRGSGTSPRPGTAGSAP